mmetsp:Transcript_127271/g.407357  ORF Transcript_127271/g.407357 Transcript_127271/m.407357 type:complete len:286 (-) Transcript_127271:389-1246(-)
MDFARTEQECLPMLLSSRRQIEVAQQHINLNPLELSEDSMRAVKSDFGIKNTFIDTSLPCSPSLAPFYQERQVRSCPSERIGCLKLSFEDIASVSTETPEITPRSTQAAPTICTPTGEDMPYHLLWPATPCYEESFAALVVPDFSVPAAKTMAPMEHQRMAWADYHHSPAPVLRDDVVRQPFVDGGRSVVCFSDVLNCALRSPLAPPPLGPAPGTIDFPSVGSAGHGRRRCKPCAFFHTKGCKDGPACRFCHLCQPSERKDRRKEKVERCQEARQARKAVAAARE